MSAFDDIQAAAFSEVHSIFGDVAVWKSKTGDVSGNVLVLAKNVKEMIDTGITYEGAQVVIEYYEGAFPGLYEKIYSGSIEYLTVNGMELVVLQNAVEKLWDGKTYKLYCSKK